MKYTNQTAVSILFFYTQFSTRDGRQKEKMKYERIMLNEKRNQNVCLKGSKAPQTKAYER